MKKDAADAVGMVKALKERALDLGASDIFLSAGSKPSCRINNKTIFFDDENTVTNALLEFYLMAQLGADNQGILKNRTEYDFAISSEESGKRFRANVFWQMGGLSIVFRYIPEKVPSFEQLNLPNQIKKALEYKNGLVLVTGAMGSGKSTTLASLVDLINKNQHKHIVTIEDPIEFIHHNELSLIEQRELEIHTKDFSKAIRSCLRQAADVILVGELRNLETIQAAITAAETGALVLGTLHTNGAAGAVNRLIDVFPPDQQNQIRTQLADVLRCVVWQTLLPLKKENKRVAAFEILFQNYAVSSLIRDNKTFQLDSVIETGQMDGMVSMKKTIEWLLSNDLITQEVAHRTLPQDFDAPSLGLS
jgi:twitching motility protein PilT